MKLDQTRLFASRLKHRLLMIFWWFFLLSIAFWVASPVSIWQETATGRNWRRPFRGWKPRIVDLIDQRVENEIWCARCPMRQKNLRWQRQQKTGERGKQGAMENDHLRMIFGWYWNSNEFTTQSDCPTRHDEAWAATSNEFRTNSTSSI